MKKLIFTTRLLLTFLTWLVFLGLPAGALAGAGNALEFDGVDDYVELTYLHIGSTSFTVELWVNVTPPIVTGCLIGKNDDSNNQFLLMIR
ncbi:MAG: LamG domain-containing protein, partial [Bacteroides sp.]|nr:LamG domain-containing protein [Bacteroides sp.]